MIKQFTNYFTKLERLSSDQLLSSAKKLAATENSSIAKLIAHLAEMSSRKTALKLGYSGLYYYCIECLNLSEGAVPARLQVANVSRRFPQLLAALAESRISLTVAALLAPHLTQENVEKLISDCAGMTRRRTEEYLVAIKPKPVFEPSIRKRPSATVQEPSSRDAVVPPVTPSASPSSSAPEPSPIETGRTRSAPTWQCSRLAAEVLTSLHGFARAEARAGRATVCFSKLGETGDASQRRIISSHDGSGPRKTSYFAVRIDATSSSIACAS